MIEKGNEAELIADATAALGGDEEVLAAGMFGCQDLVKPEVEGQMAGGLVGSLATNNALGMGVGVFVSGLAAKKAAAESKGMTLKLIVAVTATKIHVLNGGEGDAAEREYASFDRAITNVKIKKWGMSRMIDLYDTATDARIYLHGAAAPYIAQSGPDKDVMKLLAEPAPQAEAV